LLFVIPIATAGLVVLSQWTHGWAAQDHAPATRKPLPSSEALAKLPPDGGPEYNRLVFEKSPYLLQHAGNPVDWYPWGQAAFEKAGKENKPIFLSIGYSTCHWCHVMEHESFEDPEVAKLMNEHFVCIKLDREERPDVDNVYMTVCQAMTGSGGWPLTIMMTPDKKPFFAGTYFPKEGRFGRPGMVDLLPQMGNAWNSRRGELLQSADQITTRLQQITSGRGGSEPGPQTLDNAFNQLSQRFDEQRGGFGGGGNKFPIPHNLTFLLRYWKRSGDERALKMVEKTLQEMRAGGIFDHVGFGFHRYSTDPQWLVPHFEKMLYDQALLTIAYVEAYQATGKEPYAQTAREILTYVLRDMTAPQGGFYSAEDADSEGVEGKFYLWTDDQIDAVLDAEEANLVKRVFNLRSGGNFRNPHTPPKTNILHLTKPLDGHAVELGMAEAELRSRLEASRQKLFNAREQRVHAYKDDKVLTDWNGLMIAALAKAARALDEPKYAEAAERAADFVLKTLRDERGRLLKRYRDGAAGLPAHVEDYAFFIWGLLELYETTFDVKYLTVARELNRDLLARFWDGKNGGLFFTADDSEALIARSKEIYDGAIPSGNSVAMLNLLRLGRITGESNLEEMAAAIGKAFSGQVSRSASGHTQLMCGLEFGVGPSYEVVIAGDPGSESLRKMLRALRREFVPNKVVLLRPCQPNAPPIVELAEFTRNQKSMNGQATAYVCRNYTCKLPTTDPQAMLSSLLGQP
jgi:hypothetical protein